MNYRVYLSNHGYFAGDKFTTFQEALAWARSKSFEVSIWEGNEIVGTWSPISGTTMVARDRSTR